MLKIISSNELFTVFLMVCLLFVSLAKLTAPKRFEEFLLLIGNSKYLKIYHRDPKILDQFDALLYINLVIGLATFFYSIRRQVFNDLTIDYELLIKLIIGIGSFILIKILIERFIASVFEIDRLIDHYLFQKTSYKNYLGLILIPINAILLYSFNSSRTLIYIVVILFIALNIKGFITSIKTHQNVIVSNLFYFILYLCALEIAPYIILYKVLIS